jgi:hypothetical protein
MHVCVYFILHIFIFTKVNSSKRKSKEIAAVIDVLGLACVHGGDKKKFQIVWDLLLAMGSKVILSLGCSVISIAI